MIGNITEDYLLRRTLTSISLCTDGGFLFFSYNDTAWRMSISIP
jgi:hypothetical protein